MQKNVLITGANGGIGKALCKTFVEAGYFVIASDKVTREHHKKKIQWSCEFRQNFHKPFFKRGKTFNPCFNYCHYRFGEFNPRAINGFYQLDNGIIAVFSRMRGNKILERLTVQDSNTPHSCDYRYIPFKGKSSSEIKYSFDAIK